MPDNILTPPVEFASPATGSPREGYASPREGVSPQERESSTRESPTQEERHALTPEEERNEEHQRAVQAVREITASDRTPAEQEGQRYDWDALCDAPLGLPGELPNRVSDPEMPPMGDRGSTHEWVTSQGPPMMPVSQAERETDRRSSTSGRTSRGVIGEWGDTSQAQETTQKSRILTPDPHRTDATRDRKEVTQKGTKRPKSQSSQLRRERFAHHRKCLGLAKVLGRVQQCRGTSLLLLDHLSMVTHSPRR